MSLKDDIRQAALDYHKNPRPGKITVAPTKPLTTQKDLSLAYSPGVAAASEAIAQDPQAAADMTIRSNLVAVITNGTAVLGLGDIGPLAAKPVMEGKGVLFKKFAGIDVFDIEVDEKDPDNLVDIIASLAPTFGGINLEDIKSPECFEVEKKLSQRLNIPVFHDDQHGTAIITAAAVINALKITGKDISQVKLVTSGAGAAGMACVNLLVDLGLRPENIILTDSHGVVTKHRPDLQPGDPKCRYATDKPLQSLEEALEDADIFLGVSVGGILKPHMIKKMARQPIILALANPIPEIMPDAAKKVRPDAIIATGRSDFPNQVNNVLCFPYIFRGALDVGATTINDAMKKASVFALAQLAREASSDISAQAYGGKTPSFGPDYLIPQPFDPRILLYVAPAVAQAAMDSGVATRPLDNIDDYRARLSEFVYQSGLLMRPVFDAARADPKRVVFAEGEDERVLRAVQTVINDGLAKPILIGRPEVVKMRLEKIGLKLEPGRDFELVNPQSDPRFWEYWSLYHEIMQRKGVTPDIAKAIVRTRPTVIAALMVRRGEADAMLAGLIGRYPKVLRNVIDVLGLAPGVTTPGAISAVTTGHGNFFLTDTYVNEDPDAADLTRITQMAAEKVRLFGKTPHVALISYSTFGSREGSSADKMRQVFQQLQNEAPELEAEGEMEADLALMPALRQKIFPNSRLKGKANLFVFPNLDAANTTLNMVRCVTDGVSIGPMLLGCAMPAHVLSPNSSVRRLVNMTALAVVDAQQHQKNARKQGSKTAFSKNKNCGTNS